MPLPNPQHVVLIAGGAVAGSEAAFQFAQRGIVCIVLEQNDRPYGKIEDGLPRWHVNLRLQEEKKIDDRQEHAEPRPTGEPGSFHATMDPLAPGREKQFQREIELS